MRRLFGPADGDRLMPIAASSDAVRVNRRRGSAADGVTFWHTLYIGTTRYNMAPGEPDPAPDALFPMAFLVEQDPGSTANSHFHQQDQFQVVVGGQAMLGTHAVGPVTVHFTGAYTAYGPIRASADQGVHYFTLRNGFDPGARFMADPANRSTLRQVPGRRHREAVAGPAPAAAPGCATLLGPEPDGMAAWRYTLRPGERITGPDPATGRGQYWVVVGGDLSRDGALLAARSCCFVQPDDAPFEAEAGPEGLDILALQFPHRPAAPL
jgi:hypothetical protein